MILKHLNHLWHFIHTMNLNRIHHNSYRIPTSPFTTSACYGHRLIMTLMNMIRQTMYINVVCNYNIMQFLAK